MAQMRLPEWFKEARSVPCAAGGGKAAPRSFIDKNLENFSGFMREVMEAEGYSKRRGLLQMVTPRARIAGVFFLIAAAAFSVNIHSLAAAVLFGLFLLRQLRYKDRMVDLALFRRLPLSAAFLTNGLVGGALIVAMVNVPLFTNVVLDGSPLEGGLNLMRLTLALPFGALAGGFVAERRGLAAGAALGLVLAGAGFLGMASWPEAPSFLALTLPLLLAGFGFGLVIAPLNTAVMDVAREGERATLASLLTVVRLLGALVGVALLTTRGLSGFYAEAGLVPLDDPRLAEILRGLQVGSFQDTFLVTAAVCFASVLPAMILGRWGARPSP